MSRSPLSLASFIAAALLAGCSSGTTPPGNKCQTNAECPVGHYCNDKNYCDFDCSSDDDCQGGSCSSTGKCVGTGSDGGPDGPAPDGPGPDVLPPDGPALDVLAPDVLAPDVLAPDVLAPDVLAPDILAPDTLAPDTLAPDILAPDILAPDTGPPPVNNNLCSTPQELVLLSGLASASDTTATATNDVSLSSSSCTGYSTPGPDRFYTVNLQGGKLYEVTLTPSASFDPALYVLTSCSDLSSCEPGMGSDRLAQGVEEKVLLAPQVSRAYIIAVDSYASFESGAYTLTIKEFPPPLPNNTCAAATALSFSLGAASASGNTYGATSSVDLPSSGCTGWATPGPDLFYSVYLTQGYAYRFELRPEAGFDPSLAVFSSCSDVAGSCEPGMGSDVIGSGEVEEVIIAPSASGTYYAAVDSWSALEKGSFLLTITQLSGPLSNDTCGGAEALTLAGGSARAIGDTRAAPTNAVTLGMSGCTSFSTFGDDLFYSFSAAAGKQYTITLKPASYYDASLYVFSSCSDPEGTCGAGHGSDNYGDGVEETVTYNASGSGTVYIAVDSYTSSEEGTFELTIVESGVATCGPGNCAGCCQGNVCMPGTAKEACGSGGAACSACGAAMACVGGSCALDPQGWWRVVVYSASIMPTNGSGGTWDSSGVYEDPDPFVDLFIGALTATTTIKQDTLYPLWNQSLLDAQATDIKSSLSLDIWDADFLFSDLIGSCTPAISDADLIAGYKLISSCGRAQSVWLDFFAL